MQLEALILLLTPLQNEKKNASEVLTLPTLGFYKNDSGILNFFTFTLKHLHQGPDLTAFWGRGEEMGNLLIDCQLDAASQK